MANVITYKVNGKEVSREEWLQLAEKKNRGKSTSDIFGQRRVNNAISEAKPWKSIGMGVPSNQVDEFNRDYEKAGIVGAHHTPDGTLVCESNNARNEVLSLRGYRDNDACYRQHSGK